MPHKLTIALLLIAVAAQACGNPIVSGTPTFVRVDQNHDRIITEAEARRFPPVLNIFERLDRDNNNELTEDEYRGGAE